MKTTTIDLRPKPFELPFFYEQLDTLAINRMNLWLDKGRTLGEGSVFLYHSYGMCRDKDSGELIPYSASLSVTKQLEKVLHRAKDFAEYEQRHADKHDGLDLTKCHEWGNAPYYDGSDEAPRSLIYGIRLSFNDGSVLFFVVESKRIEDIDKF